jgi:hypothetical protein
MKLFDISVDGNPPDFDWGRGHEREPWGRMSGTAVASEGHSGFFVKNLGPEHFMKSVPLVLDQIDPFN